MRKKLIFFRRIKIQLTLWYVLLLAIVLAVFSTALYLSLRGSLLGEVDTLLVNTSAQLAADVDFENSHLSFQNSEEPGGLLSSLVSQGFAVRLSSSGVTLQGVGPYVSVFEEGGISPHGGFETADISGRKWRVFSTEITAPFGRANGDLQVAEPLDRIYATLSRLLFLETVTVPAILFFSIAAGAFMARRALKPIEKITQLAKGIEAVDLSRRLELELPDDEIGRLARTFNGMLARLETAFVSQSRFVSEAAHELRTPLTIMKGTTEVALGRERTVVEYQEVLGELNAEIDQLAGVAEDLLALSRADSGKAVLEMQEMDLSGVAGAAVERIRPLARERGIDMEFRTEGKIQFRGDVGKLTRLFLNLLDNAIRYSAPHGRVSLTLLQGDEGVVAAVRDSGPGISSEELDRIFDHFHRAKDAREKYPDGSGLGLSIARWIARAHGGEIEVESQMGRGTTFKVVFPA